MFDDLARGRANAMATLLRGQVVADGEPELLILLPAALPGADRAEDDARPLEPSASGGADDGRTQMVRILDGNTFVVCDERGDVEASPTEPTGLFSFDTRFLSKWVLTIDGQKLNSLSIDDLQYFQSRFFLVPGTGTVYIDAKLSVIRERSVGDGFHEELTVLNHESEPVELTIRIDAASDFADLFEVKDALKKVGDYAARIEDGRLHLQYTRETFKRETVISASAPASIDEGGLTFAVRIEPHGSWTTDLDVVTTRAGRRRYVREAEIPARPKAGAPEHGAEPRAVDRGRAPPGMRPRAADRHLQAQPGRPGRPPVLAAGRRRQEPAGRRVAVVHDDVRPRQHLHQPPVAPLHARAGGHDPAGARRLAGQPP